MRPLSLPLHPKVEARLAALPETTLLGLCVSGGPDSMALLHGIHAHFPERRKAMRVLHFNHRTQRKTSDEVAAFVAQAAHDLSLRCTVGAADEPMSGANEGDLRKARQAFFASQEVVYRLTGHHANDVAENILLRLARGEGTRGLSSMRPIDGHVLRPLLHLRREEIRAALDEAGIRFWDDPTNEDTTTARNFIRHVLLPTWQAHEPRDLIASLNRSRDILEREYQALPEELKKPPPVPAGAKTPPSPVGSTVLPLPGSVHLPNGAVLQGERLELTSALRQQIESGEVPSHRAYLSSPAGPLRCRFWEYGDSYTPLHGPGRKKLQDAFVDRKIPQLERKTLPVVLKDADCILWVPGLPPAHGARITAETEVVVALTYRPPQTLSR